MGKMDEINKPTKKLQAGLTLQKIEELNLKAQSSCLNRNTYPVKDETTTVLMGSVENKEILPRTITVFGFGLGTAHEFMERVHKYYTDDPNGPVLILVMSYGGMVDGLMGMIGTIKAYPTIEFRTLVSGTAMSCAAVLLSVGRPGKRYALAHSRIMVHKVSSGMWGNIDDLENEVEETKRLNAEFLEILAENTNFDVKTWEDALNGENGARELYIPAEEALKIGIVDEIVTDMTTVIPVAPFEDDPPDQLGESQDLEPEAEDE